MPLLQISQGEGIDMISFCISHFTGVFIQKVVFNAIAGTHCRGEGAIIRVYGSHSAGYTIAPGDNIELSAVRSYQSSLSRIASISSLS
jgi:hypothetical protein